MASTATLGVLVGRPLGLLWRAIAQNEERLQLLGYATDHIKANAYALSALLAAGAGALFATHQGIVTPQAMSFVLATESVLSVAENHWLHLPDRNPARYAALLAAFPADDVQRAGRSQPAGAGAFAS